VELVAVAVTVTVASPSPEDGLTDIPEPLAEAVQGLLALTWTVCAPPSAENARFSGVTVRTGSGVVLHPKSKDASPQSRMGKRRFIIMVVYSLTY
jgi:hypothetical protein